jgi:hypothetical protein
MHARIEQLLSLRDGEPVDSEVRTHVEGCAQCTTEVAATAAMRERLRALPSLEDAARDGWAAVESKLAARQAADGHRVRLARFAAVASLAVVALVVAWRVNDASLEPDRATRSDAVPPEVQAALTADRIARLQSRSAALEQLLNDLPARPSVERAATSLPIDTLEAQVQWVDHQISGGGPGHTAGDVEDLWRDRVEAMDSLLRLRYLEASRIAL